jgi:hypothetical protein
MNEIATADDMKALDHAVEAVRAGCKVSFDIHWCDTHRAVKPEGMACAGVSAESAALVAEIAETN